MIYSPIDPFKLIDILASVNSMELQELRTLYNEMLNKEKGPKVEMESDTESQAADQVFGIGGISINTNEGEKEPQVIKSGVSLNKSESGVLIIDYNRRKKYQEICDKLSKEKLEDPPEFDGAKLRQLQKEQSNNVSENAEVKGNRKHFLKTLFSMEPKKAKE